MKAVGYLRVSTEEQAREGISLEAQRAKIEAWALLNDAELTAIHVDAGISGKAMSNRPGLQQALSECKPGMVLVVYSLSRLSRSTEDTLAIHRQLTKAKADLVSLSEKLDSTSAAGKAMFRMMAVMAELERDQISERTATAMQHKKSRGELVGAVPYGYSLADDGVKLVPNETEQAVITAAKELHSAGLSLRKIAEALATRGMYARNGGTFQATQVKRMVA